MRNARRPGVADVDALLLSPREIYLLGKTVGSTNIAMLDRSGRCIVVANARSTDSRPSSSRASRCAASYAVSPRST